MRSMRHAHIVVVADSDRGIEIAARLRRMAIARVTAASGLLEARRLCDGGGADACVVLREDEILDAPPRQAGDAPGSDSGVPTLIIVPAATLYIRKSARREGYQAVIQAGIAPRMLYRRIGAALQHRRASRRAHWRKATAVAALVMASMPEFNKPTLH